MKDFKFLFVAMFFSYMALAEGTDSQSKSEFYKVEASESEVEFVTVGKPGFLRINGEGKNLTGTVEIDKGNATFTFGLDSLATGMDMRDRHMKEKYLEVKKYPEAKLVIQNFKLNEKYSADQDFQGELTLHGVTKPIKGHSSVECAIGKNCDVEASLELKLSDFGIAIPEYAGITVAEKVEIKVETKLVKGTQLQ